MWKLWVSNRRNWVVYFQVNHWLEVFSREPGRIKCTVFSWYIIKFLIGYWSTITRHIIVPRVERYVEMNLFCRTAYLHSRIWIRAEFFGCGAIAGTSKWILKNSVGWWLAANNRNIKRMVGDGDSNSRSHVFMTWALPLSYHLFVIFRFINTMLYSQYYQAAASRSWVSLCYDTN